MSGELSPERVAVLNEVFALVGQYWRQYGEPVPLKALSQKYSKRFGGGESLIRALEGDSRFVVDLSRSAAYRIGRADLLPLNERVLGMLKRHGGRLTLKHLLAFGGSEADLTASVEYLKMIGSVQVEGDWIVLSVDVG